MHTALFDRSDVFDAIDPSHVIEMIEDAFVSYTCGEALMPPKSYVELPVYNGDFRSMPAYVNSDTWDAAGIKWVNVHPDNPDDHGLPTVMGIVVYSDPETGAPIAIMDGTELTRQRTGAAAAVATDHLAVDDATSLGVIGAGAQSFTQLTMIAAVRPIETVVVSDPNDDAVATFRDWFADDFSIQRGSIAEAGACDILSTLTPVRDPIVDIDDVGERTHINAVGADAAGKQELTATLLADSTVVIDDWEQCTHSGEINVPWAAGTLTESDIHGTIGEVIVGESSGRDENTGRTVFDSTGLAIQDVATAHAVYEASDHTERTVDLLELS